MATLRALFDATFGGDLVFKGGTSLSKAYDVVQRFSEDVDITYDIRAFAPDLVGEAGEETLPPTRSQERRWTRAIRARLAEWVRDEVRSTLEQSLAESGFPLWSTAKRRNSTSPTIPCSRTMPSSVRT